MATFEPITLTIFPDPEAWLRENLDSMTADTVAAVRPVGSLNLDGLTLYRDHEEGEDYECDLAAHVKALRLLCEMVGRTLFVGGIKSPFELLDPGSWDVEVVDAYWQLVALEEVAYG